MQKMIALVGSAALALTAMSALALADEKKDDEEWVEKSMTAEIMKVDVENNTLTVKRMDKEIEEVGDSDELEPETDLPEKEITLSVPEDAQIYLEGKDLVPIAALDEGEFVNVTYRAREMDGEWVYYLILLEP